MPPCKFTVMLCALVCAPLGSIWSIKSWLKVGAAFVFGIAIDGINGIAEGAALGAAPCDGVTPPNTGANDNLEIASALFFAYPKIAL